MSVFYVSSCVEDGGLYRYLLNKDGTLNYQGKIPANKPMYAVFKNEKLYVLEREPSAESSDSMLRVIDVSKEGIFKDACRAMSTGGICAPHLCIKDGIPYVVNYLSGSVRKLPYRTVMHEGSSVHPTRQEAPHPHFITEAPDGYLLVCDLGTDCIYTYDADLNRVYETAVKAGNGPRHLVFSADGNHVFCANELSSTVSMYRYCKGCLQLLDEKPTLPDEFNGENTAAAIRFDEDRVYVSNRGHNSIACLRAEEDSLLPERFIPCYGSGPRDFDIVDNLIISANETSDSVTVIDLKSGKLLSETSLPKPLCVTVIG